MFFVEGNDVKGLVVFACDGSTEMELGQPSFMVTAAISGAFEGPFAAVSADEDALVNSHF